MKTIWMMIAVMTISGSLLAAGSRASHLETDAPVAVAAEAVPSTVAVTPAAVDESLAGKISRAIDKCKAEIAARFAASQN